MKRRALQGLIKWKSSEELMSLLLAACLKRCWRSRNPTLLV